MDIRFARPFKIILFILLFFFVWSFGGIFDIAYAVNGSPQSPANSSKPVKRGPDGKFQKTLDDIEEVLTDTSTDTVAKKSKLKTKKAEIVELDEELKKQFAETEKKLKDANLPDEILQRHYKFVKHYEDNRNELETNLDAIETAKTDEDVKNANGRAKAHLEKVKPPKKHIALDPNKLPHRTAEPVYKEPRTKPEEFKGDSGQLSAFSNQRTSPQSQTPNPILIASNGDLSGLLSSPIPTPEATVVLSPIPNPQSPTPALYALADPPTDADLAETIEVQFTPEIQAKAAELGYKPVKIYEYVRNNFEYEPYYGSLKGAQQTVLEMAGNDFDQASLLIALLRASNIPARYVYGTIELPIEKFMNWVGGVTDPNTAAQILATAGVPGKLLTEAGQIKYVQFEHVWVEAYVPYGNYRGSMRDDTIKTWIPMDPSFKQYEYRRGMDLYQAMAINGEQYLQDYINDTSNYPVPEVLQPSFPDYITSPYQYYSKRFFNYVDINAPYSSTADLIGAETIEQTKTIIKKEYPYLLGSLSYKVIVRGAQYAAIPDNARHKITFGIVDSNTYETLLTHTITIPETAGKRMTLSYIPASSTDQSLVAQYEGLLNVPPYLINVKPVVKINGIVSATGRSVGLGYEQTCTMTFKSPNKGIDIVSNQVNTGDYSAIAIQYFKTLAEAAGGKILTLIKSTSSQDIDELLGQLLSSIGTSYFHKLTFEEELYVKNFQMIVTREPAEAIITSQAETEWLYGMPYRVEEGGIVIDVDRNVKASFPIDGNRQKTKDFMIVSGLGTSAWESMILQAFFGIPSVSAATILKIANRRNIPIYTITQANMMEILPQLQLDPETTTDMKNAVNMGKTVAVPKTEISYNDWTGSGYIVIDPITGAGAYMISGGLAGGGTSKHPDQSIRVRSDWSASVTQITRRCIVDYALYEMGSPYVIGGETEECGFDCSGFVYYIFKTIYGTELVPRLSVSGQHSYLENKGHTLPYSERLPGDILWRKTYGHTGIYYGKGPAGVYNGEDLVIHALGHECTDPNDPKGWNPSTTLPPTCGSLSEINKLLCGKRNMVIITPVNVDWFVSKSSVADDIGRPMP